MPGTFFGPHSEQYSDYAAEGNANLGRFPLGHTLILPDGREYHFTLNDGTVEVAGSLYQSTAGVGGHFDDLCDVARAIGAIAISATLTATAAAVDIYSEGIVHTNDDTGQGYSHRIRRAFTEGEAHAAAASTGVLTVALESGESVQVALTTASRVTFTRNRYHAATIHESPPSAALTGVSPGVAAANRFYWSQVRGYAAVLADLTLLEGLPVQASIALNGAVENVKRRVQMSSTGSVLTAGTALGANLFDQDGSVVGLFAAVSASVTTVYDISGGISVNAPPVGTCVQANASTDLALIDLRIT